MSSAKRPGGLTALAVFNFIFGGLGVLTLLGLAALMLRFADVKPEGASADQQAAIEAFQEIGTGMFTFVLALSLISSVLLILSGIGYLKLKKFLGRTLGNAYAILGVAGALASGLILPEEIGGGFSIGSIVNLIYPVLTLILLNVVFKEDFVH